LCLIRIEEKSGGQKVKKKMLGYLYLGTLCLLQFILHTHPACAMFIEESSLSENICPANFFD